MSNDVSKVYQFLANLGNWNTVADTNSDGSITKSEFREFMEQNFEWDGETTEEGKNDLINSFWKSIDTKTSGKIAGTNLKNKNALDSSEITNMETKIQMYETMNEFIASNVQCPSVVSDSANWKKSVTEGLSALVEKFGKLEGLEEHLAENAETVMNKTTADYCANEYLNSAMSTIINDYGYAYASDATLTGLIDEFVNNIPEGTDSLDIQSTVVQIIDAYLATAGMKEDNGFDLSTYGYNADEKSALNDLQKSVLQKTITDALSTDANYEKYPDLYATAIEKFMGTLKNGDFETVKADAAGAFNASEAGVALQNTIEVKGLFDFDSNAALKTALEGAGLGESFVSMLDGLMKGEVEVYDKIKEEAATKAQNGDFNGETGFDINKAIEWITGQIKNNLAEFYGDSLGDASLTELKEIYENLEASAMENDNADGVKEAAIKYCNALADKSTKFAETIKMIFGDNYATEINGMKAAEIQTKIDELMAEAEALGDANELSLDASSWANIGETSEQVDLEASKKSALEYIEYAFKLVESLDTRSGIAKAMKERQKENCLTNMRSVFPGGTYNSAINNCTTAEELQQLMDKFMNRFSQAWSIDTDKTNEIMQLTKINSWKPVTTTVTSSEITLAQGETKTFNIAPTFKDEDGNTKTITTDRISYKSSNTSLVNVDQAGNVTVTGANAGTFTVTVAVLVDGVEVGKNTLTIVSKQVFTAEALLDKVTGWDGATVEHVEAMKVADGNNLGNQATSENFADLYNGDAKIVLHWAKNTRNQGWGESDVCATVKNRLGILGNAIASALATAGLDENKLITAAETVINRYMNAGPIVQKKNSGNTPANCFNYMNENRVSTTSRIVNSKDTDGKDSNIYMIHFKDFVNDIIAEYNNLI